MGKYFGTDGVRGIANQELTPELAFKLGRFGAIVLSRHIEEGQPQVLVGRDTRISCRMLEYALVSGLLSAGAEVLRLGVITTPGVSFLTRSQNAAAGIMISASHNPVEDNGIKFFGPDGFKLSDQQEAEIESLLDSGEDDFPRPAAQGLGTSEEFNEGSLKYTQFLSQTISGDLSGLKIVLDGANGAASPLINRLFADLDTEFDVIGASPNGLNINDGFGSTHPENLAQEVVEKEAQVGLAFDGDGDRLIAVDEKGKIVDGDKILFICGRYLANQGRLKQNTIVTTVMSNLGFYKAAEKYDIDSVQTKVGDRFVVEEMRDKGYNLGGEQSGHIIFLDHHTTGDGLLTAIQLLDVMKQTGKKLSDLASDVENYPQKLVNVSVTNKEEALNNQKIQDVIAEVEAELASEGRVLVRPSGTEPLIRVMVEGPSDEAVDHYCQKIVAVVKEEVGLA